MTRIARVAAKASAIGTASVGCVCAPVTVSTMERWLRLVHINLLSIVRSNEGGAPRPRQRSLGEHGEHGISQ